MYNQLFEKLMEVVATVDLQKEIKDYYKGQATKLKPSTFGDTERDRYKFWLLQDGTVIPVDHTHRDTVKDATARYFEIDPRKEFLETGAASGYFNPNADEMGIEAKKKLTTKQISAFKNLYLDYKVSTLYAEIPPRRFMDYIRSVDELDYVLTYGKDIEEAKSEEDEKEKFFIDRTSKHIQLVQGAAAKIVDAYPEFDRLLKQVEVHDASKLEEPERTPYIAITWRHKQEREVDGYDPYNGKGYQPPGELEKEDENAATMHHITTNSHHPEYHLASRHKEANVDSDDRSKSELVDAALMPEIDIAEMVADWQAMAEELQTNTARQWFEKQKDVRWHFSESQEELISKLLAVFEERKDEI